MRLLDIIWPPRCELCSRQVDRPGRYLCSDCLMRLPINPVKGCCRRCGRDVPSLDREFLCDDCRRQKPSFDRVASSMRFEEDARRLLLDFKFNRHHWLCRDFVDLLEGTVRARFRVDEIDRVIAMPGTVRHQMDRGYNPAGEMAAGLARRLSRPYSPFTLRRVGTFLRQGGLDEDERRENVVDTIAVTWLGRRHLSRLGSDATVLVVDDVMTTGSTLSECARILKRAGVGRVWAISLVRSVRS